MNCYNEEQLWLFYDGRFTETEREKIYSHLLACPKCKVMFDEIHKIGDQLNSTSPVENSLKKLARKAVGRYYIKRKLKIAGGILALAAGFILVVAVLPAVYNWVDGKTSGQDILAEKKIVKNNKAENVSKIRSENKVLHSQKITHNEFVCGATGETTESSEFRVLQNEPQDFTAQLFKGWARFKVIPGTKKFHVETPDALIKVCGTVFSVNVFKPENSFDSTLYTEVVVERGKVRVEWRPEGKLETAFVVPGKSFSTWKKPGLPATLHATQIKAGQKDSKLDLPHGVEVDLPTKF